MKYGKFSEVLQDLGRSAGQKELDEVRTSASNIAETLLDKILQSFRDGTPPNFRSFIETKTAKTLWLKWNEKDTEWLKEEYGCEMVLLEDKDYYMRLIDSNAAKELYKNAFHVGRNPSDNK